HTRCLSDWSSDVCSSDLGTLTIPAVSGKHPAVVMITGSGAQNRDEEILGFKLFKVIADHFTRNGIAVLRYDDRGVGGSTGGKSRSEERRVGKRWREETVT